jgi:hypothetical protein
MTMKRTTLFSVAALGALAAGSALALDAGTPVYIRARNTHGYSQPNGRGKVTTLQPSTSAFRWQSHQGTWNELKGPGGKTVWVYGPNLSLTPPKQELLASSSGASPAMTDLSAADAIKGLGSGAQWYAGELSPEKGELARRSVATAEAISYQAGLKTRGAK